MQALMYWNQLLIKYTDVFFQVTQYDILSI